MKRPLALRLLLLIQGLLFLFHLLILFKVIPYDSVWGGNLISDKTLFLYESISLLITGLFIFLLLTCGQYLKLHISHKMMRFNLRIFLILNIINTVANLLADTTVEKMFAIITILNAALLWSLIKRLQTWKDEFKLLGNRQLF